MRYLISIIVILAALGSLKAQVSFSDNFDSGHLDSAYQSGPSQFTVAPPINLHFRVTGVRDSTPEFRIWDTQGYRLRNAHRMVFRYEGDTTWHFFSNGSKTGGINYYYFDHNTPFSYDTVYIAYWYPYPYQQFLDYMTGISGNPNVRNDSIRGYSHGGRELWGYEVTDTSVADCYKQKVVVTGKQHPVEFLHSYIIEGLSDYLIYGTDTFATELRRRYRFFFYPMMNPDGVFTGSGQNNFGQDLNRAWTPGPSPGGTLETDIIKLAVWNDTGGSADYSFDLHANAGSLIKYYWWGQTTGPNPAHIAKADLLVERIEANDALAHGGNSLIQDYIQGNTYGGTAFTAGNWMFGTLGAVSYTFEPSSVPPVTIQRLREVGEAFARGLYDVLPPAIVPMSTTASISPNICHGDSLGGIAVSTTGGAGPYTYLWSTGDTSSTISGLPAQNYWVEITDTLGCTRVDTFQLTAPPALMDSISFDSVSCYGDSSGSVDLDVSGGIAPYQYLWSNGETTQDLAGLPSGGYSVTVTDSLGCSFSDSVSVPEPDSISLVTGWDSTGQGWVIATGGTPPFSYLWNDPQSQVTDTANLGVGTWWVNVTDNNGCQDSATVQIPVLTFTDGISGDQVRIYPNPFNREVLVTGEFSSGEIQILNLSGKQVYSALIEPGSRLDLSHLPGGFYLFRLSSEKGSQILPMIKILGF